MARLDYGFAMTIVLPPAQQEWLDAQIAKGEFASLEDAVRQLIAERMAESDDLGWAKPYAEEARAALDRGEAAALEQDDARTDEPLKAVTSR